MDCATGAFGGAPYGATNRVRGVPKWACGWRGGACGRGHWGLGWSSLWGHEPCEGCADMGMRWSEARMGGGRRGRRKEGRRRGALSLQNEDPTPQDGWEKLENIDSFASSGPSWGSPGSSVGACGGPPRPPWGPLGLSGGLPGGFRGVRRGPHGPSLGSPGPGRRHPTGGAPGAPPRVTIARPSRTRKCPEL